MSFGGGSPDYHGAVDRICGQAAEFGVFDKIYGFKDINLVTDATFWQQHSDFLLRNRRGMGYWIWKPYLIQKVLNELNDGDILVYIDSGSELNIFGKSRFLEYIEMVRNTNFLAFQIDEREKKWTKADLFNYLQCDDTIKNSGQIESGAIFLRKCESSVQLIEKWYQVMCHDNYRFITDSPSTLKNDPSFVENRHDQSCLSCIAKQMNLQSLKDESYFHPNWHKGINFPIWALRNRTGRSIFKK